MGVTPAHSSSLLGRLQRGRGAGFLAALAADPMQAAPLLLACILDDPRFDRQLEQRDDYYARLAIHLRLSLDPLEDYLRTRSGGFDLPLAVLARMARRGDGAAAAILVRYLAYGPAWSEAFDAIVGGGHSIESLEELGSIILRRFPDAAVLAEQIDGSVLDSTTWDRWAAVEPRVAPFIAAVRDAYPHPRSSEESIRAGSDPAWNIPTLLSRAAPDSAMVIGAMIGQRAGASDLPLLLDAFLNGDPPRLRSASRALAMLQLPAALPPLQRFVADFDAHHDQRLAYYRLNCMRRILAATPAALPIARAWLGADGWACPSVALSILAEQSEETDVPVLRAVLASAIEHEPGEVRAAYIVSDCLLALRPFAADLPYRELAHIFEHTWSSWNRREAAALMADGHPATFMGAHAVECLWDCEDQIIALGCVHADPALPMVRDRLDHLGHSPDMESFVRSQAAKRLQTSSS